MRRCATITLRRRFGAAAAAAPARHASSSRPSPSGTILVTDDACARHDPGASHPENPARLATVLAALEPLGAALGRGAVAARDATRAELARVHTDAHLGRVDAAFARAEEGGEGARVPLDADTVASAGSRAAALRAAGAACAAVEAVAAGKATNAFVAVRPPGHHAEPDTAMGFCFYNNVMVAAAHARTLAGAGIDRVSIVDFDVHHGNGSQAMAWDHAHFQYVSTHQGPGFYPGTGAESETGAHGNVLNVCLPPGSGPLQFRKAFLDRVVPALTAFDPHLLLVSAGFDAHARDPLAQLALSDDDFAWATRTLLSDVASSQSCGGRVVSLLEGGYDTGAGGGLATSVAAHVGELCGVPELVDGMKRVEFDE